jgi:hypothetical protein
LSVNRTRLRVEMRSDIGGSTQAVLKSGAGRASVLGHGSDGVTFAGRGGQCGGAVAGNRRSGRRAAPRPAGDGDRPRRGRQDATGARGRSAPCAQVDNCASRRSLRHRRGAPPCRGVCRRGRDTRCDCKRGGRRRPLPRGGQRLDGCRQLRAHGGRRRGGCEFAARGLPEAADPRDQQRGSPCARRDGVGACTARARRCVPTVRRARRGSPPRCLRGGGGFDRADLDGSMGCP